MLNSITVQSMKEVDNTKSFNIYLPKTSEVKNNMRKEKFTNNILACLNYMQDPFYEHRIQTRGQYIKSFLLNAVLFLLMLISGAFSVYLFFRNHCVSFDDNLRCTHSSLFGKMDIVPFELFSILIFILGSLAGFLILWTIDSAKNSILGTINECIHSKIIKEAALHAGGNSDSENNYHNECFNAEIINNQPHTFSTGLST